MQFGFVLPQTEAARTPAAVGQLAAHAESLGYSSLWSIEHQPIPAKHRSRTEVFDGATPDAATAIECPLELLAAAAVFTETIRLGLSIPNVGFYSPVSIARSLAALDVVSSGRAQLALGLGSTTEAYESVRAALTSPSSPASEFVEAVKAVWAGGTTAFLGEHYYIPPSQGGVTPVQQPHPPVYLAAFAPAAVCRPQEILSGECGGGRPDAAAEAVLQTMAEVASQGIPGQPVVRAQVQITDAPLGEDRPLFAGSLGQVRGDVIRVATMGASEILFDLSLDESNRQINTTIARMTQLIELAPRATQPVYQPAIA